MSVLRPDVVLDCNVLFQALARERGPAAELLRLVEQNHITLHLSKPILRELRRILSYPQITQRNPQLNKDVVGKFVRRLLFRGILHHPVPHLISFFRDPGDEPYLDLVTMISADYLITRDQDLLTLATEHSIEAKEFRQRNPHLHIVDPVVALSALEKPT
ncbi:MAG TPA: putative toxin-antitoxin system toxin component, PIN family [Tepidisphaeraceae bacterium]|jgi:putative PIN family toxin of toxin-antitoxin system